MKILMVSTEPDFSSSYQKPLHSYVRIATSGDRRDPFQAGKTPAARLMVSERSQTRTRSFGRKIGAI